MKEGFPLVLAVTFTFLLGSASAGQCANYLDLASPEASKTDLDKYQGFWYEVESANVGLVDGCECTRYNFTRTGQYTFTDVFKCHKGSPTASPTVVNNHGSVDHQYTGKMVESLGPVSPPYWVLQVWGQGGGYDYSLVYACVDLLVTKLEYVYFFSRNSSIPTSVRDEMRQYALSKNISLSAVKKVPT